MLGATRSPGSNANKVSGSVDLSDKRSEPVQSLGQLVYLCFYRRPRKPLKFETSATVLNESEEWVSGNVVRSIHLESKCYGNSKTMRLMG